MKWFEVLKRSLDWFVCIGGEGHVGRGVELRDGVRSKCLYGSDGHGVHVSEVVRGHRKPTGLATVRRDSR